MNVIVKIILGTITVLIAAYILPGVVIETPFVALVVAVVLAVVNTVVRPILILLTLPVTVLTFGLFIFAVNAATVLLVAWLVPGFDVAGFWWALLFSLVVSLVSSVLYSLAGEGG